MRPPSDPSPPPGAAHLLGEHGAALLDLLSYVYLRHDRPEKAAALLAALDALGLADARLRISLALAQLRSGKPETALGTLDRVALQGGLTGAFHLVRAQTLVALGREDEAEAAMRIYVSLRARQAEPAESP
ncbi:type III secretion apparatus assembly chaperone SctY [Castellaniella sp. WN]